MLDQDQTQPIQDKGDHAAPPDTPVPAQGNSSTANKDLQQDEQSYADDNISHSSSGSPSATAANKADKNVEESNVVTPDSKTNNKKHSVDGPGKVSAAITRGTALLVVVVGTSLQ